MMFCSKCGHKFPDSGAFCSGCGSARGSGGLTGARPATTPYTSEQSISTNNKKIIIIAAVAVLVAVAALVAFSSNGWLRV